MNHSPRSSNEVESRASVRRGSTPAGVLSALLVAVPLLLGARDCERVDVGDECENGTCAGNEGSSGSGGGSGGAGGGCEYAGEQHDVGDTFPDEDGCNTCSCMESGVSCTLRLCADERACGGLTGLACEAGEYCNYAPEALCGAADATGVCADIPSACTREYDPVCGCDDETYANACEAAANGVSVVRSGECDGGAGGEGGDGGGGSGGSGGSGQDCGGLLGTSCPDGEYCDYAEDALCGAADAPGTCTAIPEVCTLNIAPVCGCDDQSYDNACEAAMQGVSVSYQGRCRCGARSGPCPEGQYCLFERQAMCGAADAPGTCEPLPEPCGANAVCGCDDQDYDNACDAEAAGASVAYEGACGSDGGGSGVTCGGIASLECPSGDEFCNYEESAGGQGCDGSISDAGGVCQTRPSICQTIYDPVCGCDRRTYGNDCEAHAAGVSVLREDACTELDCEAIGGHAVDGFGPAPMCPVGETDAGPIRYSNGMIAIEGTICCVQ